MNNKREVFIIGTRPEIIKMAPLIKKINPYIIHSGQHKELAKEAFKIFDIEPDINLELMKTNQTIVKFIVDSTSKIDVVIKKIKPKRIWVLGDTMTALTASWAAFLNDIPLIHVEAGLRTHDKKNPYPEEMFRIMIDQLSDTMFAPTKDNVKNLKKENIKGNIYEVGNTIVDALEMIKPKLSDLRPMKEPYVLLTMHRRESFGKDMNNVFGVIKKLSEKIEIIFPAHPNPNVRKAANRVGLSIIQPRSYLDFLWYLKHCKFVMSDSGGIQEEVSSFDKPILILRKVTERQEILKTGYAFLTSLDKKDLHEKVDKMFAMKNIHYKKNPFGDGKTSDRIIKILEI